MGGIKKIGVLVPACPEGRHVVHPGVDCAAQDEWIAHERAYLARAAAAIAGLAFGTQTPDVPAVFRGPSWRHATGGIH